MTPRKADLRVAHQAGCANTSRTALGSLNGCTCKRKTFVDQDGKEQTGGPRFYVSWRDHTGATRKSERTLDRQLAEKMFRAQQVEIDRGNVSYHETKSIAFPEWAGEYERILEERNVRAATTRVYKQTLDIARDTIGHINLRAIGPAELDRFMARIKTRTEATRSKHLRQLGTCLAVACDYGYLEANPVPPYKKRQRLRPPAGTPPYTDDEIERLLAAMAAEEHVYQAIVRAAITTGARVGELVALDWSDVSLSEKRLEIRHTYNADGIQAPKDHDERTVYLTPAAVQVLEDWTARVGAQTAGLVFPAPRSKHHLNADYLRKVVAEAMRTAKIDKLDERTRRPRKPWHSFRSTFARQMLEQGRSPQWVQAQLGHATLELTYKVYGQWTEEAMAAEAAKAV